MFGYQMSEISRRYFDYAVKVTTSLAKNDLPFPDVFIVSLRAPSASFRRKVVDVLNLSIVSDFLFGNTSTGDYIVNAFVKYLVRHGKIYEKYRHDDKLSAAGLFVRTSIFANTALAKHGIFMSMFDGIYQRKSIVSYKRFGKYINALYKKILTTCSAHHYFHVFRPCNWTAFKTD